MDLTDEQRAVRAAAREVAAEAVRPTAAECDREERFPEDAWDALADRGLTAMTVPEAHGGLAVDPVAYALVNEAVAYGSLAVATALSVHALATECLATFAEPGVAAEWLPAMADGRPVGAFALSEPEAGSNPREMTTVATREGEEYVLDGEKQWITNGRRAGVYVVFATTDPGDSDSIAQFLVPADVDGVSPGEPEEKLGLRASDTTSLALDGARIPAKYRLTDAGRGLAAALSVLTRGRVGIAAQSVGLSRAALDAATDHVRTAERDGEPLAEVQAVRHRIADVWTTIRAARAVTMEAARALAVDDADARTLASAAKYFATESAVDATGDAVDLCGEAGYVSPGVVERCYRDAKVTTIYEGTSQIQLEVIGRALLE